MYVDPANIVTTPFVLQTESTILWDFVDSALENLYLSQKFTKYGRKKTAERVETSKILTRLLDFEKCVNSDCGPRIKELMVRSREGKGSRRQGHIYTVFWNYIDRSP